MVWSNEIRIVKRGCLKHFLKNKTDSCLLKQEREKALNHCKIIVKCIERINIRKRDFLIEEYLNVMVKIQELYNVIFHTAFEGFKVRRQQAAKPVRNRSYKA